MSQTNEQKIFAKLGYGQPFTFDPADSYTNAGVEFLRKVQAAKANPPQPLTPVTSRYSGTDFVELFKENITDQEYACAKFSLKVKIIYAPLIKPLSKRTSPEPEPENDIEISIEDEVITVWNCIVAIGMKDVVKDRKFMRGKCFYCSKAAATYLLYPCLHLNRCEACFRWENINNDIKCLLCGKRSTGFMDVMAGKTQ